MTQHPARTQRGLGAVSAVLVLVVLASLAATLVRLSTHAQTDSALALQTARANQAARAGLEWGLYQAFRGAWANCANTTQTLDLSADTGMRVTVSCNTRSYNEGESAPATPRTVRIYTLDAVACNSTTACPDATLATSAHYVERRRQVVATD